MTTARDSIMFTSTPRSTTHAMMASQQNHAAAGYFGYYPQHQGSQMAPYQTSADFNCNFQPLLTHPQVPEGFQSSWYNPMYMPHQTSPHPSMYHQQRTPNGYEDWGSLVGGTLHSSAGGSSPVPPTPSTSSSTSSSIPNGHSIAPPHTPSPCAGLPNSNPAAADTTHSSPPYYPTVFCRGPSDFGGEQDSVQLNASDQELPMQGVGGLDPSKGPLQQSMLARQQEARANPYHDWIKKPFHNQSMEGMSAYTDVNRAIKVEETTTTTYMDIDKLAIKGSHEEEEIGENSWKVNARVVMPEEDEDVESRESSWKVAGKTRTKDKYRAVYSDHQRVELEKEFHYSRYITIRRKSELATLLGLSERQVKIWFQNRRAKERKQMKKRDEIVQKDKMEAGMAFHHSAPPLYPIPHHHQHPQPIHSHTHPHQVQQHHGLTARPSPILMDVKPPLSMD